MLDELTWFISFLTDPTLIHIRNPPISTTAFQSIWGTHIENPRFPNISINRLRANRESHIRLRVITSSRVVRGFMESLVRDPQVTMIPQKRKTKIKGRGKIKKKSQKPRAVLGSVPATIRIVVLDNRWLLLDNVRPGAAAGHRRAEEYIDYQHDEEQDAESYRQP